MSWFKMFNKYDTDGTGRIDFDEVRCAARDRDREAARSIRMIYIYELRCSISTSARHTPARARPRDRSVQHMSSVARSRPRDRSIQYMISVVHSRIVVSRARRRGARRARTDRAAASREEELKLQCDAVRFWSVRGAGRRPSRATQRTRAPAAAPPRRAARAAAAAASSPTCCARSSASARRCCRTRSTAGFGTSSTRARCVC